MALNGGFVQYAAVEHERRASLLQEMGRDWEARRAHGQALALYKRWEAHAKLPPSEDDAETTDPLDGIARSG